MIQKFYVALVEGGIPKFSESPVAHDTLREAETEAARLANKYPGKTYQSFQTSLTNPITKPAGFSLAELRSSAPQGVYRMDGSLTARIIVTGTGSGRAVLATSIGSGRIEAMRTYGFATRTFVPVKDTVEFRINHA